MDAVRDSSDQPTPENREANLPADHARRLEARVGRLAALGERLRAVSATGEAEGPGETRPGQQDAEAAAKRGRARQALADLADRARKLEARERELARKARILEERGRALTQLDASLAARGAALSQRVAELDTREVTVRELEAQTRQLHAKLQRTVGDQKRRRGALDRALREMQRRQGIVQVQEKTVGQARRTTESIQAAQDATHIEAGDAGAAEESLTALLADYTRELEEATAALGNGE